MHSKNTIKTKPAFAMMSKRFFIIHTAPLYAHHEYVLFIYNVAYGNRIT